MHAITDKEKIINSYKDLLQDQSNTEGGIPCSVYFPESTEDLRFIIKSAAQQKKEVTFIGGHTGTTGGSMPPEDSIVVSFSKMNHIQKVILDKSGNPVLICEPGITLTALSDFLASPDLYPVAIPGIELLRNKRYCYLPDPTEKSAQLGGTVATNASGARSFRFGPTRAHIDSLLMIFSSGDTLSVGRDLQVEPSKGITILTDQNSVIHVNSFTYTSPVIKNASGLFATSPMDLIDLFIGSEGTLAAFSSIGIRLCEQKQFISGCTFFPSRENAFAFADYLRNDSQIASIEFFDESSLHFIDKYRKKFPDTIPAFPKKTRQAILWEFINTQSDQFESRIDSWENVLHHCESSFDATWSGVEPKELELLKKFRHALPETVNATVAYNKLRCRSIRKIGTDTALPSDVFNNIYNEYLYLIEQSNLTYAAFGHLGDYHIHINLLPSNETELERALSVYDNIMSLTIAYKGTISAEHGIGKLKKKYLVNMYGTDVIDQMRMIKTAFDPDWQFNPGTLF